MTIMVSGVILLVTDLPMASIKRIITGVVSSKWPIQKRRKSKFGNISMISKEEGQEAIIKDNELKNVALNLLLWLLLIKKHMRRLRIYHFPINFSAMGMNSEMIFIIFGAGQILCKCFYHTIWDPQL